MVVEADESDGSFTRLPATICIVTNIDPEHLDHYQSFDEIRQAFDHFVTNVPFYGFATMCIDHPEVQAMIPRVLDRRIVTYGFSPQADVRAVNLTMDAVRVHLRCPSRRTGQTGETVRRIDRVFDCRCWASTMSRTRWRPSPSATRWAMAADVMRDTLARFSGVKRRFTKTGVANGVTVIDDYGHHPVEIAAVLRAARSRCRQVRR